MTQKFHGLFVELNARLEIETPFEHPSGPETDPSCPRCCNKRTKRSDLPIDHSLFTELHPYVFGFPFAIRSGDISPEDGLRILDSD